jgi:hypothetical protein
MSIDHITLKFTISEEASALDAGRKKRNERSHDPKVPTFPPIVEGTAQKLREIIGAGDEQSPLAYAALSRLCVLWTPNTVPCNKHVMVNELIGLMAALFPKD